MGTVPKVSIVVLSHRPEMMGQATASARAQTWPNTQVVEQFDRQNWASKFSDIVRATKGEWIIPLCDDDLLAPTYVERCMEVAHATTADVVYTDRLVWQSPQNPAKGEGFHLHMHGPEYHDQFAFRVAMPPGMFAFGASLPMTIMISRHLWDRLGGYDDRVAHADTEFWYRAVRSGATTVYVPAPLFWYRQHPMQLSRTFDSMTWALKQFHRKHFHDFGFAFDSATTMGTAIRVQVCPPEQRVAYAAAHFTSLTTTGYMATETKVLAPIAKMAIQLTIDKAQTDINAVIAQALTDARLSAADGWKVTQPSFDAVRETPDAAPQGGTDAGIVNAPPLALVPDTIPPMPDLAPFAIVPSDVPPA